MGETSRADGRKTSLYLSSKTFARDVQERGFRWSRELTVGFDFRLVHRRSPDVEIFNFDRGLPEDLAKSSTDDQAKTGTVRAKWATLDSPSGRGVIWWPTRCPLRTVR